MMHRGMGMIRAIGMALVVACGLAAGNAQAEILIMGDSAASTEGLGQFTGSIDYVASDSGNAVLTLILTNTSPLANGGYITALAFNNPGNLVSGITLAADDPDFGLIGTSPYNNNSISVSPFGDRDFGASLGNDWLGGGNPNPGLGVGATGTFVFTLTGTGLNTLTTASFLADNSLVVRFRGFEDGGSDKVPTKVIPEPSTVILGAMGLGLLGLAARRRKMA